MGRGIKGKERENWEGEGVGSRWGGGGRNG